ncbi:MAG: LacI family transcriptional regulator, partial [Muricomes sp.]
VQLHMLRLIRKHDRIRTAPIIANDVVDENTEKLEAGLINFLIGQDAEIQGSEPLRLLYQILVEDIKPKEDRYYTPVIIKNRYNI